MDAVAVRPDASGETEAIRIEAPGVDKAEFVVTTGRRRELHQVKRNCRDGKWSLYALRADGLLEAVGRQLRDNDDRFVLASGSDARELADLSDAARDAESVAEFQQAFLAARPKKHNFEIVLDDWACSATDAFRRLRRIDVHTIDERELRQKVQWGLAALFLASPREIEDTLRGIALDSVHRTLTRQDLLNTLSTRGYRLRRLTTPQSAATAVRTATDRYLTEVRAQLIPQHDDSVSPAEPRPRLVPRDATKALFARLGDVPTQSVLTGSAGSGKTGCVIELVETLRQHDTPLLAFRLDRHVAAPTTADLGKRLDLEESPALVLAAAVDAAGRTGVLIVDQLDAVSTASGRSSGAFALVEQLLIEARASRPRAPIHVVVVCREFDWQNDSRLRLLVPDPSDQVAVTGFTAGEVKEILAGAGFDPPAFRDRQLRLLQLPQNLSLFLQADFDATPDPTFRTATQIFDRYWETKQRIVEQHVPASPSQWGAAMQTLSDEMTSTQQLSVLKETLDRFPIAFLDALASEGVITRDGHRLAFVHESFFDYVFARVFVTRPEPLTAFLKASQQHLFRRAQVRQVLAYLRDPYPDRYTTELRALLADHEIRPHVKDLAFALLADVTDPTEEEWEISNIWIAPAIEATRNGRPTTDKLSALAWRRLFSSRSWFLELDRRGLIEDWLASENDALIDNLVVDYLRVHQRHSPDRVAALLEPYADGDGAWRGRLRHLMECAEHHTSRRFFDLFLGLVDNGTLDEARDRFATNGTFWLMLGRLGNNRPDWIPEVLARRLRRRLALRPVSERDPHPRVLFDSDQFAMKPLMDSAERTPAPFVEHVLPLVLEISDAGARDDAPPRRDAVWPTLIKTEHPSARAACLFGLAGALALLARTGTVPDHVITELHRRDTYTANYLLMALYRGGASRYADEASARLCDEPWRFQCGFSGSLNWCAMETIQAIVPHCTPASRERLEAAILDYVSPHERTAYGHKQFGRTRYHLLSAFPARFRSGSADVTFRELARKFGAPAKEPRGMVARLVTSPIAEVATKKMSDEQWLRAIAKHSTDDRFLHSDTEIVGGAWELAQALEQRVKEDPIRFARLALKLPTNANPAYLERTLVALVDTTVSNDVKVEICRKAFVEAPSLCRRSIADVLGGMEDTLPDDAVGMLNRLATGDEASAGEPWRQDAADNQMDNDDDMHYHGINSTRGRAAGAIRDLIVRDAAHVDRFRSTLNRLVRDPSAAVRSCVAGTLRAVARHDEPLAMSLFRGMDLREDRLLSSDHVYQFILGGLRDWLAELRPFVERMLRSVEPAVRQAGARLASIAALLHESAADFAADAVGGDAHSRRGVAEVASANVGNEVFRSWCETRLRAFFNDPDAEVRGEAASCFSRLPDETLNTYEDLIAAFCDSRALEEGAFHLLYTLEHSRGNCRERRARSASGISIAWPRRHGTLGHIRSRTHIRWWSSSSGRTSSTRTTHGRRPRWI